MLFGGTGSDTLSGDDNGSQSADRFVWKAGDDVYAEGDTTLVNDVITDFQAGEGGDVLDLADLLKDEQSGSLEDYLSFNLEGGNTVVSVTPDGSGAVTQKITLEGVNLTTYGDDTAIITKLIEDGNLNVD